MTRYKVSKRTIFVAATAVLLSLVCLTGSTLALFTSNPKDGTIGVITTAGDIAIDIVDRQGNSLVGNTLQFQTTAEHREILFEPGAVYRTQEFQIKNIGNIHVNFILTVSEDERIDMDAFNEAFEVWISSASTDTADARLLTEFRGETRPGTDGYLPAGQSDETFYCLFVKMKESAGNEFQGSTYEGIGITVHAVQGNVSVNEGVTE